MEKVRLGLLRLYGPNRSSSVRRKHYIFRFRKKINNVTAQHILNRKRIHTAATRIHQNKI